MLGTIVNTCAIIIGSCVGVIIHKGIKERYKTGLYNALGLASLAIGLNATISHFPESRYPVLFILSMAIGSAIGTALDIEGRFRNIVKKYSKQGDKNDLANGLSTAILLYCIGPLSILGPIISSLKGDNTLLFTNATLDFVSSIIFSSTYGIGIIFAAPILFCWQGLFYLIAQISGPAMSEQLIAELLIVGGLLITSSGLSLLKIKDCKTLNLLPALIVPILWYLIKSVF